MAFFLHSRWLISGLDISHQDCRFRTLYYLGYYVYLFIFIAKKKYIYHFVYSYCIYKRNIWINITSLPHGTSLFSHILKKHFMGLPRPFMQRNWLRKEKCKGNRGTGATVEIKIFFYFIFQRLLIRSIFYWKLFNKKKNWIYYLNVLIFNWKLFVPN